MIVIIGAMSSEVEGIKARMQGARMLNLKGIDAVAGEIYGKKVVLCRCGVGKVFAAAAAATLLALFEIGEIINIGVAGGVGEKIKKMDIVVGERTVMHDFDLSAVGLKRGQINGNHSGFFVSSTQMCENLVKIACKRTRESRVFCGTIATGDRFVADSGEADELFRAFSALACDMESAAIAQVAEQAGVRFASMRCISDGGDDTAAEDFSTFEQRAADLSAEILLEYIRTSD